MRGSTVILHTWCTQFWVLTLWVSNESKNRQWLWEHNTITHCSLAHFPISHAIMLCVHNCYKYKIPLLCTECTLATHMHCRFALCTLWYRIIPLYHTTRLHSWLYASEGNTLKYCHESKPYLPRDSLSVSKQNKIVPSRIIPHWNILTSITRKWLHVFLFTKSHTT